MTYNGKPFEFEYCETHDNIIGSVFGNKPFPDCELLNKLASCSLLNTEETVVENVSLEEATSRVKEYIRTHPKCKTSDIVLNLGIDPDVVLDALSRLEEQDEIEEKEIEQQQ